MNYELKYAEYKKVSDEIKMKALKEFIREWEEEGMLVEVNTLLSFGFNRPFLVGEGSWVIKESQLKHYLKYGRENV